MKRAFTLIELLVVIAIIAILAAILFPVFAQAKAAAKGTASLSNVKQTGLAFFMYTADVDDTAPLDQAFTKDGVVVSTSGYNYNTWAHNLNPYMKSYDLLTDPLATPEVIPASWSKPIRQGYVPEYGYNYSTWSPVTDTSVTPWPRNPISMTAPAAPAETVLLTDHVTSAELGGIYSYGGGTMITSLSSEPPDCSSRTSWCFAGWGVSSNYTPIISAKEAGKYTGGNAPRRSGNIVVAFGDGHASAMKPGRLAAGTNYIDGTTTQNETAIVVTDVTKYMWDIQ